MLIERNRYPKKPNLNFLLITVFLVALLAAALFLQTMFSFKPRYEAVRADQRELQQDIDQLGRDIDALRQEVSDGNN